MTNEEREFHINVVATDRTMAEVYTDDPIWIARMDKWYTSTRQKGDGKWYQVPTRKIVRLALLQRKRDDNDEGKENDVDEG